MIPIGDFARLGQVSVRMLRHYDSIGLLIPAAVDSFSGYRRYAAEQLAQLNRIVALKDLGFTLEQVGSVLDAGLDVEELRGMLRLRRGEIVSCVRSSPHMSAAQAAPRGVLLGRYTTRYASLVGLAGHPPERRA